MSRPEQSAAPDSRAGSWAPSLAELRLLGDGRSVAMLSPDGSVEWWCAPEFDDQPQVQQRQHLVDLRGFAAPRRQDHRTKPHPPSRLGVDPPVVNPRSGHLHRPGRGQHLPALVVAVAHHHSAARLIPLRRQPGEVSADLGLQRLGQHPPGALPNNLIDQRGRAVGSIGAGRGAVIGLVGQYGEHGSYLPDRRCRPGLA